MKRYYLTIVVFISIFFISAHGEDSLGINTHILHNDVYDAVSATGIPWVRIDINWFDIESQQGKFNWNEIDRVVNKAISLNLKIFATFAYTPQWASSGNKDGKQYSNDVPKPDLYEKALSEAVKRYRGKIYHWGLWNEVNLDGFWEGTADQYVDLIVIPGYSAVKNNCPECFTLGPELANVGDVLNDFYNTIFSRVGDKFDIITHHIYQTFLELDPWAGYTSDSFFNALEKKRTFSNRMALYEALSKYNMTNKDVWITETGYRCEPPADQSEMNNQKLYYELVLKAQIERDWWTNTFFYEIYDCGTDIPDCSIDGYGILRRTAPPDNSYKDNFLFKPAYYYLRDFMDEHPEFKDQTTSDAGYDITPLDTSSLDSGVTDTGIVKRKRIEAIRVYNHPAIDGNLNDFYLNSPVILNTKDYVRLTADSQGDEDISARFYFMWDENNLYIAAVVRDNLNYNTKSHEDIWQGDSVQMAFDADLDKTEMAYDKDGDYEIGFAIVNNTISVYRWVGPLTASPLKIVGSFKKSGNEAYYEVSIPFSNLTPFKPVIGNMAGISFLVNDNDGNGREGFIQLTDGIGLGKNPAAFGEILLGGGACEIEKGCSIKDDCRNLFPECNCPGEWICNGRNVCEWICTSIDAGVDIENDTRDTYISEEIYSETFLDTTSDFWISIEDSNILPDSWIKTEDISIIKDIGEDTFEAGESLSGCGCNLIN